MKEKAGYKTARTMTAALAAQDDTNISSIFSGPEYGDGSDNAPGRCYASSGTKICIHLAGYFGIFGDFVFRHFVSLCQPALKRLESFESLLAIVAIMDRAAERGTKHGAHFGIRAAAMRAGDMFDLFEVENSINLNWCAEAEGFELFPSRFRDAVTRPVHFGFEIDLDVFETGMMKSFGNVGLDIGCGRTGNKSWKQANIHAGIIYGHAGNHSQVENGKGGDFWVHDGSQNFEYCFVGSYHVAAGSKR